MDKQVPGSSGDPDYMMSLARGLAVLRCFADERRPMTIAQASRLTRLACADTVLWNDTDTPEPLQTAVAGLATSFGLSLLPE